MPTAIPTIIDTQMAHPDIAIPTAASLCANCGTACTGAFCSACGQEQSARLSTPLVVGRVRSQGASFLSRLVRTAWLLTTEPARVGQGYLQGQRSAYTSPLKYMLIAATAYMLALQWISKFGNSESIEWISSGADSGWKSNLALTIWPYTHMVIALLAALPQRWLFGRSLNYAETGVLALYASAHILLIQTPVLLLGGALPRGAAAVIAAIQVAYLFWAVPAFYGRSRLRSMLRSAAIYVSYIAASAGVWSVILIVLGIQA